MPKLKTLAWAPKGSNPRLGAVTLMRRKSQIAAREFEDAWVDRLQGLLDKGPQRAMEEVLILYVADGVSLIGHPRDQWARRLMETEEGEMMYGLARGTQDWPAPRASQEEAKDALARQSLLEMLSLADLHPQKFRLQR